MAIRVPKKIKTFEYEGQTFALRRATTREMVKITSLTSEYTRSVRKEEVELTKIGYSALEANTISQGDQNILFEAEKYIAQNLVIDPETHKPIFGEGGDDIDFIDSDFILEVWKQYTMKEGDSKAPLETTAQTPTSSSDATSSESPNTSTSTPTET